MLFSIPITSRETIVDTPIDCKSIRSFHFFNRYGKNNIDPAFVTITIGGKMVCSELLILPFMDFEKSFGGSLTRGSKDWRRIAIPCLKNCDMDEIKVLVESNHDNKLDFEVVFEYSDVEVEDEHYQHIESYPLMMSNYSMSEDELREPYSFKPVMFGEEFQLHTHYEAEKIFALQIYSVYHSGLYMWETKGSLLDYFRSMYYYYTGENPTGRDLPMFDLTISDMTDVMPRGMSLDLISADGKNTWKDAVYQLNEGLSTHPKMLIDFKGSFSDYPALQVASGAIFVIYTIHECKF